MSGTNTFAQALPNSERQSAFSTQPPAGAMECGKKWERACLSAKTEVGDEQKDKVRQQLGKMIS